MSVKNPPNGSKILYLSLALNAVLLAVAIGLPLYYAARIRGLSLDLEKLAGRLEQSANLAKVPPPIQIPASGPATIYGTYAPSDRSLDGELSFSVSGGKPFVNVKISSESSGNTCDFSAPCSYDREYERFECSNEGSIFLNFGRKSTLEVSEFESPASSRWCGSRISMAGFYVK